MSVGAVGSGGGGAASVGGSSGSGGGAAVAPSGKGSPVGDHGGGKSASKVSDDGSKSAHAANGANCSFHQSIDMSTQDYSSLKNTSIDSTKDPSQIDMQKLIEMMIAIKLLEAMNEDGKQGGGSLGSM